jgi:hypothetical protein
MFWSVGWPLLRAEGFFCNLDVLYGGLGIGKLQFLIKKKFNFFFNRNFFLQFLVIRALDPDWIRIRSGSGFVLSLKCWIRIRLKWMRIRNPSPDTAAPSRGTSPPARRSGPRPTQYGDQISNPSIFNPSSVGHPDPHIFGPTGLPLLIKGLSRLK